MLEWFRSLFVIILILAAISFLLRLIVPRKIPEGMKQRDFAEKAGYTAGYIAAMVKDMWNNKWAFIRSFTLFCLLIFAIVSIENWWSQRKVKEAKQVEAIKAERIKGECEELCDSMWRKDVLSQYNRNVTPQWIEMQRASYIRTCRDNCYRVKGR